MPITRIEFGSGRGISGERVTGAGKGEQQHQSEYKPVDSTPTVCGA
jgi:hypothetical protein